MDQGALSIIRALKEAGFEAYLVGGCVRDLLLGRAAHDWDITTSAPPPEISRVIARAGWKAIDVNGSTFGVITAVIDKRNYEVASFRGEQYGSDSHRPEKIWMVGSLKEDLARRDFTVNAMALDEDGVIYDYFDGQRDLDRRILRTVGKPEKRFAEDPLRLFRACRFLGQLDFLPDRKMVRAFDSAFPRVKGLSLERVKAEVGKLLLTENPARGLDLMVKSGLAEQRCRLKENGVFKEIPILPELKHLVYTPQMKLYHIYDAWYHTLAVVDEVAPDPVLRWAALLHDVAKGMPGIRHTDGEIMTDYNHDKAGAVMADGLLRRWRMPEALRRRVTWLVENHMKYHYYVNCSQADALKWVRHMAMERTFRSQAEMREALHQLYELCRADVIGCGRPNSSTDAHRAFSEYMDDLASSMPVNTNELIYEKNVPEVLGRYAASGMKNLLLRVQNGNLRNDPGELYEAALHFVKRRESYEEN